MGGSLGLVWVMGGCGLGVGDGWVWVMGGCGLSLGDGLVIRCG